MTVGRRGLRTVEERRVGIAGDREPLLDGIEQLPNDLLCVGTTCQPTLVPILDGVRVALTEGNGHLFRRVTGDHDESPIVEAAVGDKLLQMELRNALKTLREYLIARPAWRLVSHLQERPSLRLEPSDILGEIKMVPDMEHLEGK